MANFTGELGLQFVTHLANHYSLRDLVRLAQLGADCGFKQIWVNDNIRYRNQMVVLTAIAAQVPIRLGTAIMVPYFHNPLDMADSFAALSELCEGREISIGIARGDLGQSPQHIQAHKPIAMVSETTRLLRRALAGEEFPYSDFPFLSEFYRLNPKGKFQLAFKPRTQFKFYGGGNGTQSLRLCGRIMDGLISSGTYIPMLKAGRLEGMLASADVAAKIVNPGKRLRRVCELNVSISADRERALDFPRRQVAHSILQWEALGFTPEEYDKMVADQDGCCAICKKKPDLLVVDHDHETGKVRQLLCSYCNSILGFIESRGPEVVLAARKYIEEHKENDNEAPRSV